MSHSSKTKGKHPQMEKSIDMFAESLYGLVEKSWESVVFGLFRMEKMDSVIFDWGGVLIENPGSERTRHCDNSLGVSENEYKEAQEKFMCEFQKGRISEEEFWKNVCCDLGVSKPNVSSLWIDALKPYYRPREEMLSMLTILKQNSYRIALLSNTEDPTVKFFHEQGYDMFDVLVFSCEEGIMKPERRIYDLTLERLGSRAECSVFIDDRPDYIQGAKNVGLHTILFESIAQVKDELTGMGVEL